MELLIQVAVDSQSRHEVGDVISIHPDGHRWGLAELAHPHWRIVTIPNLRESEALSLVASEVPRAGHRGKTRHRGMKVDVVALGLDQVTRIPKRGENAAVESVVEPGLFRQSYSVKPSIR